jgi:hypothetical protein
LTQSSNQIVDFFVDIFLDGIKQDARENSATAPVPQR